MVEKAGYLVTIADDEHLYGVRFRVEGVSHTYELFRGDDSYARLLMGYILPFGSDEQRAICVANNTNLSMKGVKSTIEGSGSFVTFTVDQFFSSLDQLATQLQRALRALRVTSQAFFTDLSSDVRCQVSEGGAE
jgi:hypothetical protein